ncbi:MAG TPA: glycosyltransferase [Verrucomicrobiae bacterium]|nr:glycosyltransferase [Verrucomicrobiae bacterium]
MVTTPVPLRLLYVTARAPFGRDEPFVMDEIRALLARGHWVDIVPLRPIGDLAHGVARELLPCTQAVPLWSWRVANAAARELLDRPWRCLRALALLLTWKPGALLANVAAWPKSLWLARHARLRRIEHIHAHWATTPAAMAMAASHVANIPWSFTAHRYDLLANQLLARKARRAAFMRVISRDGYDIARKRRAPGNKLYLLHMGVEQPPASADPEAPGVVRPLRLLCPARLVRMKNHGLLLEAFARLTGTAIGPVELWLAGTGPRHRQLRKQAKALGLQTIRWLGHLPRERLLTLYRRREIDGVVLASEHEGIPVALMDAMASGLPVIATAVGGTPELVTESTGLLVPRGDAAALTHAMDQLLGDAALRARLGAAGKLRIARAFCLDEVASALEMCFAAHAVSTARSRSIAGMRNRTSPRYKAMYPAQNAPNPSVSIPLSAQNHTAIPAGDTTSGSA